MKLITIESNILDLSVSYEKLLSPFLKSNGFVNMVKRKDKNYYMRLAATHSRAARTQQTKLKSFKEGIAMAKEAAR